jgi:hypothetical protein
VLIAIVVLVLAIATIAPLFAVGSAAHRHGVDQSQVAWIAPRVAARLQERFYEIPQKDVHGYVRDLGNGNLLLDDYLAKIPPDRSAIYAFHASFTPVTLEGQKDPLPNTAFVLHVEITFVEEGSPLVETYETVVLRKMLR